MKMKNDFVSCKVTQSQQNQCILYFNEIKCSGLNLIELFINVKNCLIYIYSVHLGILCFFPPY